MYGYVELSPHNSSGRHLLAQKGASSGVPHPKQILLVQPAMTDPIGANALELTILQCLMKKGMR